MLAAYSAIYACAILEGNMTSTDYTNGKVDRSLKSPTTIVVRNKDVNNFLRRPYTRHKSLL